MDTNNQLRFSVKLYKLAELNYDIDEKQAYALVKVVKSFRSTLVGAEVIAYMPNATIKEIPNSRALMKIFSKCLQ